MRDKPVTMLMAGGLGNQLFQFYAGLYFAISRDKCLNLDYSQISIGFTPRSAVIPPEVIASANSYANVNIKVSKSDIKSFYYRVVRCAIRILKREKIFNFSKQSEIGYSPELDFITPNIFEGYYQTWRYFETLSREQQINSIQLLNPSNCYLDLKSMIEREKPIIVHIRRGDYKQLREDWGLLHEEYYLSAIEQLSSSASSSKILVFSDEIQVAKSMSSLSEIDSLQFVDTCEFLSDFELILLMGKSDRLVISNSTFSWWSATINKTKHVVAPSNWFRNMKEPQDLIPAQWTRIASKWI